MTTTYRSVAGFDQSSAVDAAAPWDEQPRAIGRGKTEVRVAISGKTNEVGVYYQFVYEHVSTSRLSTILTQHGLSESTQFADHTVRVRNDEGVYSNRNLRFKYPELQPENWQNFRYPEVIIYGADYGAAS